jgi:predicted nucleotidyltransferase
MLDLRSKDLTLLHDLMARHLPAEVAVWAYGSRVNGNNHEASDLDLVLRTPDLTPLPGHLLSEFREALTDSNLPIFVDAHDWATLPASFHPRILARYEVVRPSAPAPAVPV